jgi:hypothetical protein
MSGTKIVNSVKKVGVWDTQGCCRIRPGQAGRPEFDHAGEERRYAGRCLCTFLAFQQCFLPPSDYVQVVT